MGSSVVVVYSGGLDSTVLLNHAVKTIDRVLAINFNYGSKHNNKERDAAKAVCEELSVPLFLVNLPTDIIWIDPTYHSERLGTLLKSNLMAKGNEIPDGHYAEDVMKKTVVPFRNGIMLSIAAGFAESHDCKFLWLASHSGDHHIYCDCRPEFTNAMASAVHFGTYTNIELRAPFSNKNKAEIVKQGVEENAPMHLTWSCYKGGNRPCLTCGTCIERTEAFKLAGIKDPTVSDAEWKIALTHLEKTNNLMKEQS